MQFVAFWTRAAMRWTATDRCRRFMASTGGTSFTEETLDHLDGLQGSRPVRIGNAAYGQLQLDIYGELMDSLYLVQQVRHADFLRAVGLPPAPGGLGLRSIGGDKDDAIWEVRGGPRNFVYSKMMCWVARGPRAAAGDQALLPGGLATLDEGPRPDLRNRDAARLEPEASGVCAKLRRRRAGRLAAADAAGIFHLVRTIRECSQTIDAINRPPARRRPGLRRTGVSLRRGKDPGRIEGHRRHVQSVYVFGWSRR